MEKRIIVLCDLQVGGERGRVVSGGYCYICYRNRIQRPTKGCEELEKKIRRIGELTRNSQAATVYHRGGVAQTLCACTHGYAMGYILRKYEKDSDTWCNRKHGSAEP